MFKPNGGLVIISHASCLVTTCYLVMVLVRSATARLRLRVLVVTTTPVLTKSNAVAVASSKISLARRSALHKMHVFDVGLLVLIALGPVPRGNCKVCGTARQLARSRTVIHGTL